MKITLHDNAIKWFETEYPLHEGEGVQFFGKTYGNTEVHEGFSIALQTDHPDNHDELLGHTEINGRHYFTTTEENWFFSGYDLEIDLDSKYGEPNYHFISQNPNEDASMKLDSVSSASKKN